MVTDGVPKTRVGQVASGPLLFINVGCERLYAIADIHASVWFYADALTSKV